MPSLHAPAQWIFLVSLILAALSIVSLYVINIPFIGLHAYWVMTLGYVLLAVGCVMKGT